MTERTKLFPYRVGNEYNHIDCWKVEIGGGYYPPDIWLNIDHGYYTPKQVKEILEVLKKMVPEA